MNEQTPFWIKFFAVIGIISTVCFILALIVCLTFYKMFLDTPLSPNTATTTPVSSVSTSTQTPDAQKTNEHPYLSEAQETMIERMGIDVQTLPTTISAEQEACAIQTLGQERVQAIIAGDTPTALEILKAKKCF